MKIDKDKIVTEALLLLNEAGLEGLTTRALALRLGVKQPALYWHFKDCRALLNAMNDAMMARFMPAPPQPCVHWKDHLFETGKGMHGALMAYRDATAPHGPVPTPGSLASQSILALQAMGDGEAFDAGLRKLITGAAVSLNADSTGKF